MTEAVLDRWRERSAQAEAMPVGSVHEDRYGKRYEVVRTALVTHPDTDKPLYTAVTVREVRVGSR